MANWKLYQSQFEAALAHVVEWTDTEVVNAVMKQLPVEWVERVVAREAKDAKSKPLL